MALQDLAVPKKLSGHRSSHRKSPFATFFAAAGRGFRFHTTSSKSINASRTRCGRITRPAASVLTDGPVTQWGGASGLMGQGTVAFGESLLLEAFAIIEIAYQRPLGALIGAMHSLVMLPESKGIDRPRVINVFRQA